ncbi:rRNA maturation RNase YbeY [Lutibacter citreus]|uniref:rRNA maturation RNase YbeY n=1 Tax=Lutibacter citreus TaxID=2138210 RepID=UPI000DBE983B|nr:rRNA maturation RNase YbeY [Lutibacter citreus]
MIVFNYEIDYKIENETKVQEWISRCIEKNGFEEGELNYIFCDDVYLHKLNIEFLQHDTLTDIISFDYTLGKLISGDIFISIDRVKENSKDFDQVFEIELNRVIIHGILHYCGLKDKSDSEKTAMRNAENDCLELFTN